MAAVCLGSLSADEARAFIGCKLLCTEMGGTILIGTLLQVKESEGNRISSIVVDEGAGVPIVWSTQWWGAVVV